MIQTPIKSQPLVSVILCGYNQEQFIEDAIESIRQQTYPNIEILIIDNGSTDGSQSLIRKHEHLPNVHLFLHATNGFITQRLNEAIRNAKGDFVSILYADDLYLPDKILKQMECFRQQGPSLGVVYSPGYRLNILTHEKWIEPTVKLSGFILRDLLLHGGQSGFINPISPLIRLECLLRYPFRDDMFVEGEAIFFRIAMTYAFHFIPEPSVIMREHEQNAGKAIQRNMELNLIIYEKLAQEPDFPKNYRKALKLCASRIFRDYGWQGVRVAENPTWARTCFAHALRFNFLQLFHPKLLIGFALSLFPSSFLRIINAIRNQLSATKQVRAIRHGYA